MVATGQCNNDLRTGGPPIISDSGTKKGDHDHGLASSNDHQVEYLTVGFDWQVKYENHPATVTHVNAFAASWWADIPNFPDINLSRPNQNLQKGPPLKC